MKLHRFTRLAALLLSLSLVLSTAASAISVEEARDMLETYYIDEIPAEVLALPTIDEILEALGDPYTTYMSPEEYSSFQSSMSDTNVVGIGVMIELNSNGLQVSNVAPDSPAAKNGMEIGDLIVAVGDVTIEDAGSPVALAALISGGEGSTVTLTYLRGEEAVTVRLTRAPVVFPTVTGAVLDGHIGWLDCTSFGTESGVYFEDYITAQSDLVDCWAVDMRNNPGGSAASVVEALGHIIGNYDMSYIVDNQGSVYPWRPNPFPAALPGLVDEPMVVLVNENSASAAELFAAAIRDFQYGLVVGERTFGKGVAQSVFELDDGSVMKITTNRYYSPDYLTPDRSGVLPHLVVDSALADEVGRLLCGARTEDTKDVLLVSMLQKTWYIHKDQATSATYAPAFSAFLSALAPGASMTLNGAAVTPAEVAEAWGVSYTSRWFDDVAASPYADKINTLATLGVLKGDETRAFQPGGQLTRAELVAMITQAMGYWCWENQGPAPFTDVSASDWYAPSVDITYHLGLVQGNENQEFDPTSLIDYQQFISILVRMGDRADLSIAQQLDRITDSDVSADAVQAFAPWARAAAVLADRLDFLNAPVEQLSPTAPVTREAAAAMIYNFMAYTGTLTPMQ